MKTTLFLSGSFCLVITLSAATQTEFADRFLVQKDGYSDSMNAQALTDRESDRLIGSVAAVRVERTRITNSNGQNIENPREYWRTTLYSREGMKIIEEPTPGSDADPTISKVEDIFDDKGNRVEQIHYDNFGLYKSKFVWSYNSKGKMIEQAYYEASSPKGEWVFKGRLTLKYDNKGREVEREKYNDRDLLVTRLTNAYDRYGNVTEYTAYNADGSINYKLSYTYEYDSVGNWIKKTTFKQVIKDNKIHFMPEEVLYRIITYY